MRSLLCIALLAAGVGPAFAAEEVGKVEKVEVEGQAAIVDNDRASARDKAIDDALRKAIESAVGTMVSSETITENYQLISDKIYSKAEGYVRKYKVLDERVEEGTVVIVKIAAEVAVGEVSKDLDGLNLLMQRKNMPRVLVMIAEQNIGMNEPHYWWGNQVAPLGMDLKTVENAVMSIMRDKGFTFVDTEVLGGKKSVSMPVSMITDKQAMRVAETTDAEIIIVGQAVAKELGKVMPNDPSLRMLAAQAEANARVINTDDGRIIAVVTVRGNGHHIEAKMAGNLALENAGKELAKQLTEKIAKVWAAETSGTNQVSMTVTGFKNRQQLDAFMKVLRGQVRSVKAVHERKMQGGKATLMIELAGDTRAMATELEAKDFGGGFKLELTDVTNNSVGVKLLP